jgi:hypothetical protein
MAGSNSGPGCLYVQSKISRPDILDEESYLQWYDEEHIPELLQTSGIKSARRFKDVDPEAEMPYLALYSVADLAFLNTEEFKKIKIKSDLLPETGVVYDLADFAVRYDKLIQVFDPTQQGKGTMTFPYHDCTWLISKMFTSSRPYKVGSLGTN